jgi:hypothetical protein
MKLKLKIVAAAAAVAMMSSGAAFAQAAVAVVGGPYTYSQEGLQLSGTTPVTLPDIQITFGNNLTYQDDVLITLPGVTSIAATVTPGLVTCSVASAVGYVTKLPNGWNFRVTAISGVTIGDSCTFTGLQVEGASLGNSTGKICYNATRFGTGQPVDGTCDTTGMTVQSQFDIDVQTPLNGVIDVYKDRLAFVDDETVGAGGVAVPADQADSLLFTTTVDGNGTVFTGPTVTTTAQTVTINGDFNWSDTDNNGVCYNASTLFGFIGWSVASTSTCAQLILNGPTTNTNQDAFFFVPGDKILNPTDYMGQIEWTYSLGSATGTKTKNWDPGIWTINGAQVYIQYMPYSATEGAISRIIYAANRGPINADATADIFYNGSVGHCSVCAVNAKTVNQLSGAIDACVAGMGITSGKVAILLTFTAPDSDIEVYSAYNVGGSDRGTVVNTSNGRSFFYGTGFPLTPPTP